MSVKLKSKENMVRRLVRSITAFALVIAGGAIGYYLLERANGWSFVDALYMSVITVSTVGLREVHELDESGRVFTIVLIIFGVGTFTYTVTSIGNYLIAGEIRGFLDQRRMEKAVQQVSDHFIVCGYGRMGTQIASEFRRAGCQLVIIDRDPDAVDAAREADFLVIQGDAGDDKTLNEAGIDRARGIVCSLEDDAMNLMITLSARALNEKLFIVARANVEHTESKLVTAGANRVLWPYGLSGRRMAQMALRPNVVEFLELVMHDEDLELWMEEFAVAFGSSLAGTAIGPARIREKTGATIVAIRQRTGKLHVGPAPSTVLNAGDIAIALGTRSQLNDLRKLFIEAQEEGEARVAEPGDPPQP